jgi:hypothetical protein
MAMVLANGGALLDFRAKDGATPLHRFETRDQIVLANVGALLDWIGIGQLQSTGQTLFFVYTQLFTYT